MARLPKFFAELARTTGTPVETLVVMGKTLRAHGLLPPSKRGNGAEHVNAGQASTLLMGCLSDAGPVSCVRAVPVYSGLRNKRPGGFGQPFPSLEPVGQAETFGAAMEALIAVSPWLKAEAMVLLMAALDKAPIESLLDLEFFRFEITISKPVPFARMVLSALNEHGLYRDAWSAEWVLDSKTFMSGGYQPELADRADKRTETTISHKTIFRIGDLIAAANESTEFDDAEASRIEGTPKPEGLGDAGTARQGGGRKQRSYGFGESGLQLPARRGSQLG